MYAVTSIPLVRRTRAIFRSAELGFFGVIVRTTVHTPRFWGAPRRSLVWRPLSEFHVVRRAGVSTFFFCAFRPRRTSCEIVGTWTPSVTSLKGTRTRQRGLLTDVRLGPQPTKEPTLAGAVLRRSAAAVTKSRRADARNDRPVTGGHRLERQPNVKFRGSDYGWSTAGPGRARACWRLRTRRRRTVDGSTVRCSSIRLSRQARTAVDTSTQSRPASGTANRAPITPPSWKPSASARIDPTGWIPTARPTMRGTRTFDSISWMRTNATPTQITVGSGIVAATKRAGTAPTTGPTIGMSSASAAKSARKSAYGTPRARRTAATRMPSDSATSSWARTYAPKTRAISLKTRRAPWRCDGSSHRRTIARRRRTSSRR